MLEGSLKTKHWFLGVLCADAVEFVVWIRVDIEESRR